MQPFHLLNVKQTQSSTNFVFGSELDVPNYAETTASNISINISIRINITSTIKPNVVVYLPVIPAKTGGSSNNLDSVAIASARNFLRIVF